MALSLLGMSVAIRACTSVSTVLHSYHNSTGKGVVAMVGEHLTEVFAYVPKDLKKRVELVCETRKGLSISKVIGSCLAACIDGLEEQAGLKKPAQGTRSKRHAA